MGRALTELYLRKTFFTSRMMLPPRADQGLSSGLDSTSMPFRQRNGRSANHVASSLSMWSTLFPQQTNSEGSRSQTHTLCGPHFPWKLVGHTGVQSAAPHNENPQAFDSPRTWNLQSILDSPCPWSVSQFRGLLQVYLGRFVVRRRSCQISQESASWNRAVRFEPGTVLSVAGPTDRKVYCADLAVKMRNGTTLGRSPLWIGVVSRRMSQNLAVNFARCLMLVNSPVSHPRLGQRGAHCDVGRRKNDDRPPSIDEGLARQEEEDHRTSKSTGLLKTSTLTNGEGVHRDNELVNHERRDRCM